MFCKYCGKELADDVRFCSRCGKQLFHDSVDSQALTEADSQPIQIKSAEQTDKAVEEKPITIKKFCENCGEPLIDGAKFCLACGNSVLASDSACPVNQNTQPSANRFSQFETKSAPAKYIPTESSKSRLVAALLAFFLGEFGAHRFYVGKKSSAIWQLILGFSFFIGLIFMATDLLGVGILFFILGLVWAVWVLVDFIMILCGSFRDKYYLPLLNWDF